MPRRLAEERKRQRVSLDDIRVGGGRLASGGEQIRREQTGRGWYRLEGPDAAEDFPAVVSRHPDRGDLAGSLVDVEVGRARDVGAPVGEVHGALGVLGEAPKERLPDADDFVRLP